MDDGTAPAAAPGLPVLIGFLTAAADLTVTPAAPGGGDGE